MEKSKSLRVVPVKTSRIEIEIAPNLMDLQVLFINLQNILPSCGEIRKKQSKIFVNIMPSQKRSFISCLNTICQNCGLTMAFEET